MKLEEDRTLGNSMAPRSAIAMRRTFNFVPPLAERSRMKSGDRVDLFFLFRGHDQHWLYIQSERLPVTVREVSPSGYLGTLDTAPVSSTVLSAGASIFFEPRHIPSVLSDETRKV